MLIMLVVQINRILLLWKAATSRKKCVEMVSSKNEATSQCMMESQMHTAGPTWVLCFITHSSECNMRHHYLMPTHKYGPVIWICVSIIKGMVVLTLHVCSLPPSPLPINVMALARFHAKHSHFSFHHFSFKGNLNLLIICVDIFEQELQADVI